MDPLQQTEQNLHEAVVSSVRHDYGSTSSESEFATQTKFSQPTDVRQASTTTSLKSTERKTETRTRTASERLPSFVRFGGGDSQRYLRMTMDTMPNSETRQILQRLEFALNVLNHICIGFVTIYLSWMLLRTGLSTTTPLHAWLVTIGFSFFMAEGVMVHYGGNVLTSTYKRNTKTTIHWVLLTLGGGCGASGALIKMIQKGFLLTSVHGKLGFAAFILCLISMLSGLSALFSTRVKKLISPLLNKTFHNFVGFATFVIALVAQYYGYQTGFFKNRAEGDFIILMKCLTLFSLVLSSIGPIKALYNKSQNIVRHFK